MLGEPPAAFKKYGQDKVFDENRVDLLQWLGNCWVSNRFNRPLKIGMSYLEDLKIKNDQFEDTLMEVSRG